MQRGLVSYAHECTASLPVTCYGSRKPEVCSLLWVGESVAAGSDPDLAEMAGSTGPGRSMSAALLALLLAGVTGPASAVSEQGTWMLTVDSVSFLIRSADGNEPAAQNHRPRPLGRRFLVPKRYRDDGFWPFAPGLVTSARVKPPEWQEDRFRAVWIPPLWRFCCLLSQSRS